MNYQLDLVKMKEKNLLKNKNKEMKIYLKFFQVIKQQLKK